MLVTVKSIKACYNLLKVTAFNDIKLPANVKFKASRMDKYLGLYFWPDQLLVVNSRASTIEEVMKIVAHEMCHAALEHNADCDHDRHDQNFIELANIICARMGWKGGV
ncbi:MAG: SprT-like domain-containing protein [Polynucleobacter sp.]